MSILIQFLNNRFVLTPFCINSVVFYSAFPLNVFLYYGFLRFHEQSWFWYSDRLQQQEGKSGCQRLCHCSRQLPPGWTHNRRFYECALCLLVAHSHEMRCNLMQSLSQRLAKGHKRAARLGCLGNRLPNGRLPCRLFAAQPVVRRRICPYKDAEELLVKHRGHQ